MDRQKRRGDIIKKMANFTLSDVFIGDFPITQQFGANPANYTKFGLKGHNGLDFGCPSNTQIVATADGKVLEVASDPTGYGNYVKLQHNGFNSLYAHLDHQSVNVGESVVRGQLVGFSDNTGNSTGAHLHFGVAPSDANGIKTEPDNGYAGYIDPNTCIWDIKNLTTPTKQITLIDTHADDLTKMLNWDEISAYCQVDKLDKSSAKIIINQIETLRGSITAKDTELATARAERDTAVSKICPDPSLHNSGTGGTQQPSPTDSPSSPPSGAGDGSLGNTTPTQLSVQTNPFQSFLTFIMRWFK